jgi:dienelactone hydrolase
MPADPSRAVFLSYASQDVATALRICAALRALGVEVWFDQNELVGGDVWDAKIRKQIAECALFVPVISANTQARLEGYFRLEWKLAAQRTHTMADEKVFLLPVVIDGTRDPEAKVPAEFKMVQWTRLHSPEAEAAFGRRVVTLLHGDAPPAPTPIVDPPPHSIVAPSVTVSAAIPTQSPVEARTPKRWLAATVVIVVLGLGATLTWLWQRNAKARHVHEVMLPQIERLIAARDLGGAYALAVAAERDAPDDSILKALWPRISVTTSIETTPAGADVFLKEYYKPESEWRPIGKTPLKSVRLPNVYTRWKIQKQGCTTLECALGIEAPLRFQLDPSGSVPEDMVKVTGATPEFYLTGLASLTLGDFFIDRYEVTNRRFKEFVDAKGYQNPNFWKQPFVRGGKTLTWSEALAEFRDSGGHPGPAGWKNGNYPEGEADFPVTGISWFEAAAFAEFAGKRLPSIYHWRFASLVAEFESMVPLSNFSGKGLARVGSYAGMSACGAYDMAGNAQEWCWNAGGPDRRYLLGGAWREAPYSFAGRDAQSPFDRLATYGFRCMKLIGSEPLPPQVDREFAPRFRNYAEEKPVSDETFQTFRSLYAYDKTPLLARVEATDDADPRWRKEKISFMAAYGKERIPAYVFLPKNSAPPFHAIAYFPSGDASLRRSSDDLADMPMVAMLVASGRAVIYPIYKTTYERNEKAPPGAGPNLFRDQTVMLAKDLGRAIDYLETRSDIQPGKLAFFGYSAGGTYGTILPTVEPRLKVSVLAAAGFTQNRSLPESDPINFAPRNTIPTLLLNGRYDFVRPLETSQVPMFKLLGASPDQKRHVLIETSHTLRPEQIAGEVYAWLDRYLGLVK